MRGLLILFLLLIFSYQETINDFSDYNLSELNLKELYLENLEKLVLSKGISEKALNILKDLLEWIKIKGNQIQKLIVDMWAEGGEILAKEACKDVIEVNKKETNKNLMCEAIVNIFGVIIKRLNNTSIN